MDRGPEAVIAELTHLCARDQRLASAMQGGVTVQPPADKLETILDAARVLSSSGTGWALIGGVAVAIHTRVPRATLDVDIAVDSRTELALLTAAFQAAGFAVGGLFAHSLNLRHPSGEPVQLAFDPGFDAAITRGDVFTLADTVIRVVTREDLIVLKERAGADPARRRSKALRDLADAELLREEAPGSDEGW